MNVNEKTEENTIITDEQIACFARDLLNDDAQHLNAATLQRLSIARHLAVNQLAARQATGVTQAGNVLRWLGSHIEHHRIMSTAMVAGAMLLTFFAAQQFGLNDSIESGDAILLASDLPPEAYADKGFDTWLVSKRD